MPVTALEPANEAELRDCVREAGRVIACGGGTKPPLSGNTGSEPVSMRGLSGIIEYEPSEFTFTALAGTPVAEVRAALAEHRQYLPFDPLLVEAGGTLGGTVAAGASGPGRFRFGGVRDFLIGIRYLDGEARMILGGGKVVKNAAGFDLPKLMVGSLGRLGILVELSFKVFPSPAARVTARVAGEGFAAGMARVVEWSRQPFEFEALELEPDGTTVFRLGGDPGALEARLAAIPGAGAVPGDEAAAYWMRATELETGTDTVLKVPVVPSKAGALDEALAAVGAERRYSAGANVCYAAIDAGACADLDAALNHLGLCGLLLKGTANAPARIGRRPSPEMEAHVKSALDPGGKFPDLPR